MATISGYNSYSMGVLFSGLNTTSSKNSLFSSSMSGSDILGINYSDWATMPTMEKAGRSAALVIQHLLQHQHPKMTLRHLQQSRVMRRMWKNPLQHFRRREINPYLKK